MTEQSYIFDFSRVPSFFRFFNIGFFLDEMYQTIDGGEQTQGSEYYELLLIDYGGDNIGDYLESDGTLKSSISVYGSQSCALDYVEDAYGDATIGLHDEVVFNIGDVNVQLKAVILRNAVTGYVMGYSINRVPFTVTNKVVFDEDVIFWDITRINRNG